MKTESLGVILMAGNVLRCHTLPVLHRQTVGQHTWRALVILHWLYAPALPPAHLTYGLIMHDVPEVYTGDMPGDVKALNPKLANALDEIENKFIEEHGFAHTLLDHEQHTLSFCDRVDLVMYTVDEFEMGNLHMRHIVSNAFRMAGALAERLSMYTDQDFPFMPRVNTLMEALDVRIKEALS